MSSEPAPPTKTQSVWTTAVNPWNCTEHAGRLPRFNPGTPLELALDQPNGIANTVAELLHRRPSSLPFRLASADERLRYLFVVVAGYPEIEIGTMPQEEPLNPRATLALALALALDTLPALSGRTGGSLRSDILWLDRVRRRGGMLGELDAEAWLFVSLAWLLAGINIPKSDIRLENVLLNVVYDTDALTQVHRPLSHAVDRLQMARDRLATGARFDGSFARGTAGGVFARATVACEHLLWVRIAQPLVRGKNNDVESPPSDPSLVHARTLEVRFHGIQRWLQASNRHSAFGPAMYRGASILIEATLSVLRRTLLDELGPGSLLIDGGGRLRFLCADDDARCATVRTRIERALSTMFDPDQPLGIRFSPAFQPVEGQTDNRKRLAWSVLPPLSITFRNELANDPEFPVLAEHREWEDQVHARTCVACEPDESTSYAFSKETLSRLCGPCLLKLRLGSWLPRERLLDGVLENVSGRAVQANTSDPTRKVRQLLAIDLNNVGTVFLRPREPLPSENDHSGWQAYTERVARRSLRFTAHWLLAVSRALQDRAHYQAEPQVFGGDDLVVGSRLDPTTANLGEVARTLDRHLERLRDELPRCDVLSFSAGLARRQPDGPTQTDQQFLQAVLQAERWAKWYVKTDAGRARVRPVGEGPMNDAYTLIWFFGAGASSSVMLAPTDKPVHHEAPFVEWEATLRGAAREIPFLGSLAETLAATIGSAGGSVVVPVARRMRYRRNPDGSDTLIGEWLTVKEVRTLSLQGAPSRCCLLSPPVS